MVENGEEVKPREVRRAEKRVAESANNPDSIGGIEGSSRKARGKSGGISRADRTPAGKTEPGDGEVAGKILDYLIKQAEERMNTAIACINWYEEERIKVLQELEELRAIKAESEPDETESESGSDEE